MEALDNSQYLSSYCSEFICW